MAGVALAFDILAKDRASSTLKKVGDTADRSGNQLQSMGDKAGRVGGRLGGFAKTAGLAAAGVAGLAIVAGKSLIDAATESQKVTKQTEAVIKSMGGSSNVTATQVADLSRKLSEQSGIDDELIQSGQNVLLTFGKVQNKVGKGNKIFDRATEAALNMSVALGTDMQGATVQIGKALNDPIKGITALSRAGVSFTQQQKDQIKWLTNGGKTLEAQKIILGELEKQFGGSAAAQATAGDKLKVIWGNLQEDLGMKLLPMFEKVAGWLGKNLPVALETLGGWLTPLTDQIGLFWGALTTGFTEDEGTPIESVALAVRDAAEAVLTWFEDNGETLKSIAGEAFSTLGDALGGIKDAIEVVAPKVKDFGKWFIDEGPGLEIAVAGVATALGAYAASALVAAGASLLAAWPFLLFAVAVGGLTWATQELMDKFDLLPKASEGIQWFIDNILIPMKNAIRTIKEGIEDLLPLLDALGNLKVPGTGSGGLPFVPDLTPGFDIPGVPLFDSGGVMPGPRGRHALAWVAGGETVLPTHKTGAAGDLHLHVTQAPGENQVDAGMRALRHHQQVRLMAGA